VDSDPNQQPILRSIGKRTPRNGRELTPRDREILADLAQYRTRSPKGVFIYYSAEEMEADRLRWTVDAIVEKHR
jgi:hypothetical protein